MSGTPVQRALGGHAAIGLLVSALLYLIALSGSIIVIHDRWQRWEQPDIVETATLSPAAVQTAMQAAMIRDRGKPPTTHLYVRMPTEDLPRGVVTTDHGASYVDGAGDIVGREAHNWTEFLIGLHEYLHLPATWGLIAVGALGVALAALVITGVLAHPRIVRDAFRLRMRQDPQIARADWHNRIGVWTLPFVLAVALTGAFIGLGSIGTSVLARAYTGGKLEAIYAPVFGQEPTPNPAKATLPDVATALAALHTRVPHAVPTYVIVHEPGTAGQHVQIIAEHPRRLIYGETYAFDARGGWRGPIGLADGAIGQQVAASAYNLHFGNYAGLPVEIAYMLFGLGLCVVTATGTSLWLRKRQRRGLGGTRLTACWSVVIWGSPLLIVALVWLRAIAGPDAPLATVFWVVLAGSLAVAAARPSWFPDRALRTILAAALIVTAGIHLLLFRTAPAPVLVIDVIVLGSSLGALMLGRRKTA
ncbi:putative iron-regulated membrane protein [Sphingomonas insulae]|nr:PepSY-associated TM helix domain-containing protein [Sphingomonas insulae]NIJ30651.1 putative iron-regulated membrane protein [Sphingomonas insulae]